MGYTLYPVGISCGSHTISCGYILWVTHYILWVYPVGYALCPVGDILWVAVLGLRTCSTCRLECLGGLAAAFVGVSGGGAFLFLFWLTLAGSSLPALAGSSLPALAGSSLPALPALPDLPDLVTNSLHTDISCCSFCCRVRFLVGVPRLLRPFVASASTYNKG